jgi:hypothetical protein
MRKGAANCRGALEIVGKFAAGSDARATVDPARRSRAWAFSTLDKISDD